MEQIYSVNIDIDNINISQTALTWAPNEKENKEDIESPEEVKQVKRQKNTGV